MCIPKSGSDLTPKCWYKLRKEAMANYSLDKVKFRGAGTTILIRRDYASQVRENGFHQTNAPSPGSYNLRKKLSDVSSTSDSSQVKEIIRRNWARDTILIRKDYASKMD